MGGANLGPAPRDGAGGGDVVGGDQTPWEGSELAGVEPSGWGRCWVAPGLGPRRRAALTAESARGLPPPSMPGPDPDPGQAGPGAMSPGLLMLLGSAVLVVFGLCCTFVHRARSRYEHIPGPPRPR